MKIDEKTYVVRQGFTLHKGDAIFHAGDIVTLSEVQAHERRHQIELAEDEVQAAAREAENQPEQPAVKPKKKMFARN